ncbi:hypothetical protein LR004_01740, partial [Candidatus Gracilibacteria bacterium]|nr:hypothetical protein [Candidatus Gracilibacteria bacterium]
DITIDVQLVINRLFAPYFPMTRLLKLFNQEEKDKDIERVENYVSIDVENNDNGIELCKLKDEVPEKIEKFFIMIYQFLTIDYDRNKEKNLGKKNIVYDFDLMFDGKRDDSLQFLGNTFDNDKLYNEMEEILFTLKDYLSNEVDELLEIYKDKEDVKNILERLRDRLKMLNFSNLIYYNKVERYGNNFREVENFARETDKKYYN